MCARRAPEQFPVPVHAVGPRLDELLHWVPRVFARIQRCRASSSSTDREQGGLQLDVSIDRTRPRGRRAMQDIDNALNNAFAQRQISTIYTPRNQYRVILEVDPNPSATPPISTHLSRANGAQVPLMRSPRSSAGWLRSWSTTRGSFLRSPSLSGSAGIPSSGDAPEQPGRRRDALPDGLHAEFAGDARAFAASARSRC